jgi:5-bromo-4-chloroindolyl phosphate hydrolysis protein
MLWTDALIYIGSLAVGVAAVLGFIFQYYRRDTQTVSRLSEDISLLKRDLEYIKRQLDEVKGNLGTVNAEAIRINQRLETRLESLTEMILKRMLG